jgi:hypothetical protein
MYQQRSAAGLKAILLRRGAPIIHRPSLFVPKSVVCFREGYTRERLMLDLIAGVVVDARISRSRSTWRWSAPRRCSRNVSTA